MIHVIEPISQVYLHKNSSNSNSPKTVTTIETKLNGVFDEVLQDAIKKERENGKT